MRFPRFDLRRRLTGTGLTAERLSWAAAGLLVAVGWLTMGRWWPAAAGLLGDAPPESAVAAAGDDPHAGHDHGARAGHGRAEEPESIRLSEQARGTLGLRTAKVARSTFDRTVEAPGVVAERPGRTSLRVAAPMTGVLTDVFVTEGQAVEPGDPLFVLRLTHEDVVRAQTEYLATLEALDVEDREIARLRRAGSGIVAGKVVLEREYEKQKLAGRLKAQRQALLLHGLDDAQIAGIADTRNLVREILVDVPVPHDPHEPGHGERHDPAVRAAALRAVSRRAQAPPGVRSGEPPERPSAGEPAAPLTAAPLTVAPLTVARLRGRPGDSVDAGAELAELHDLRRLYIEGRAFAADAAAVARAAEQGRPVVAVPADGLLGAGGSTDADGERPVAEPVPGLRIVHVANEVGANSRTLPFYVGLPNELLRDADTPDGRFVTWRYKPGQRMRLRVPVRRYENVIVLPTRAVAESGAERFVFVENGRTFERRPVTVRFADGRQVVVADDGSVLPGETVAVTAAHQLQMAMRNAAGGAPDPHAGHRH